MADALGARGLTDDEDIVDDADLFEQVTISINPEFAGTTFLFPATAMEKTIAPFELADISTEAVAAAAKRTRNTSEYLERTKIVADADQAGEVAITAQDADRVAVESLRQSEAEVRTELIRRVLTTGIVSTNRRTAISSPTVSSRRSWSTRASRHGRRRRSSPPPRNCVASSSPR
ncbi:hypothetical protein M3E75_04850 [Corynebacterium sanguinis]|uniref:hypothetical protein n=1 Tax=Corynebacterium sanguinis TaxID=2594913 RepID=UPI00223A76F3|nr:hypothetical protein [Corynebacterium sanguinis]MCT1555279.1 hypothetical protein [Corynebacterium sanguinis]